MATRLYETLGIEPDASPEQIRKAYKKKALQTHPDRQPLTATPEEKAAAQELFRKVNNAYEVLHDAETRQVYDQYGVYPPPEPEEPRHYHHPRHHRHSPYFRPHTPHHAQFTQPFFVSSMPGFPMHPPNFARPQRREFHFTDPFALFQSIFEGHHPFHQDPFFTQPPVFPQFSDHHFHDHFDHSTRVIPDFSMVVGPEGIAIHGANTMSNAQIHTSTSFTGPGHGGRWVSDEFSSKTVNGVTETVRKRRDVNGNEHVTYTYPDGQERYTINGVDQANNPVIPPPPYPGPPSSQHSARGHHIHADYAPPPPIVYDAPYVPDNIYPDMDSHGERSTRWWRSYR